MEIRKREVVSELDRENPDENNFDSTSIENEKWSDASPEEIESRRLLQFIIYGTSTCFSTYLFEFLS